MIWGNSMDPEMLPQTGSCMTYLLLQRLGCLELLCQHALYQLHQHLMAVLLLPTLHTHPGSLEHAFETRHCQTVLSLL